MYNYRDCDSYSTSKIMGRIVFIIHSRRETIMEIHFSEKIAINGVPQFVSIRAERTNLPLLLYLHGGPGDAALPLVLKYNSELEKYFTVVIWEQRGAGKSYYEFGKQENVCINTYVQDTLYLVKILLKRFEQDKVFLVGHSWGSVIGLTFCKQYPEFIYTYIGCGQVINMKKSSKIAYDFALKHASGKVAERLKRTDFSYRGEHWLEDLLYITKQVVKYKGSLYGASNYNKFVFDFIFSRKYGIKDLINREKGSLQGIRYLWQELMGISFEDITSFDVPVIFIEGKFDYHVSSKLAKEYFDTITSAKEFCLFEKSCHFPQWSEADKFNNILKNLPNSGL